MDFIYMLRYSIIRIFYAFISSVEITLGPIFRIIGPPHPWIFLYGIGNRIPPAIATISSIDGDYLLKKTGFREKRSVH